MSDFWAGVLATLGSLCCLGVVFVILFPSFMLLTGGEPFLALRELFRKKGK